MPLNNITPLVSADSLASDSTKVLTKVEQLSQLSVDELVNVGFKFITDVGLKILAALAIYIIGRWLIRMVVRFTEKMLTVRNVEVSIKGFTLNLVKVLLLILLITVIVGVLGLDTTSFVALFASAGLAFGMAMSGTLQNFAGGVMILVLKPFKVGDVVEMQGYTGIVKEIMLFNTMVNTFDNKTVLIPNGGISTGIINNYSTEKLRRVDFLFSISYGDDYAMAKSTLEEIFAANDKVLKDPAVFIAMDSLGDNAVNIVVRVWVKSADYWDVYFGTNEKVYTTFPQKGLSFPFPQLQVHMEK